MADKLREVSKTNKLLWKAAAEGLLAEIVFDAITTALDTPIGNDPVSILNSTMNEWEI